MEDAGGGDEKVEEVLSGCGLSRHAESFRRERITWDALMELEEADLTELGLTIGPHFNLHMRRSIQSFTSLG